MEGEIPRRVPRVLPFVRHRNDVRIVQMRPIVIPSVATFSRRRWEIWVAVEPGLHDGVRLLVAPEHPRTQLTNEVICVAGQFIWNDRGVELVGFAKAIVKDCVECLTEGAFPRYRKIDISETQTHLYGLCGLDGQGIMDGRFRSDIRWVHRVAVLPNDGFMY